MLHYIYIYISGTSDLRYLFSTVLVMYCFILTAWYLLHWHATHLVLKVLKVAKAEALHTEVGLVVLRVPRRRNLLRLTSLTHSPSFLIRKPTCSLTLMEWKSF